MISGLFRYGQSHAKYFLKNDLLHIGKIYLILITRFRDPSLMVIYHTDRTYLERECALWPFWWQLQQARLFYKMACICFYFYTSNLVSCPKLIMLYSLRVFFQKWPKPAQPNFLSLGVTTISMFSTYISVWSS